MAENEIAAHKTNTETPLLDKEPVSGFEKALFLYRSDRFSWLLILLTCLIVVFSFNKPFQWMFNQWFAVEENSPGPIVPILFILIVWSQFRTAKARPVYGRRQIYAVIGAALVLGTIAYLSKNYKNRYPQYEIYGQISFDILFYVFTLILVYISYLFYREGVINPVNNENATQAGKGVALGMTGIILALIFHFLGMRGDQDRISILAFIGLMYSLTYFLFGKQVGKGMLFPYAILLFILPMEFLDDYVGGPLRELATDVSVSVMKKLALIINMEVIQDGTKFSIDGKPFEVSAACSGLRSLIALTIIGASYAYISQPTVLRKILLGMCAIPIALFTNVIRLVLVGITCHYFDQKRAMWVHDNAIFLYILAIIVLFSLDKIFDRIAKSRWMGILLNWLKARFAWLKVKDF